MSREAGSAAGRKSSASGTTAGQIAAGQIFDGLFADSLLLIGRTGRPLINPLRTAGILGITRSAHEQAN
jgi:hypothetical protein